MLLKILRKALFTGWGIVITNVCIGQTEIKPLKVGDKVPDLLFKRILNHTSASGNLSSFSKKLIILDIWSKSCAACIAAFPHMQKLQGDFKNDLSVVLVTEDSYDDFVKLRNRSPVIKSTQLPFVIESKDIRKYFPSTFVPLNVWIDSNLTVIAITSGKNATHARIQDYIRNGNIDQSVNKKMYEDFNVNEPLFIEGKGRNFQDVEFYSFFLGHLDRVPKSFLRNLFDTVTFKINGVRIVNQPLSLFVNHCFGQYYGRTVFELADSNGNKTIEYCNDNEFINTQKLHCYELRAPEKLWGNFEAISDIMINDMKTFFGISLEVKDQDVIKVTLNRLPNLPTISSNPNRPVNERVNDTVFMENVLAISVLDRIEDILKKPLMSKQRIVLFADNTNYSGVFNIKLAISEPNIDALNRQLRVYGLELKLTNEREKVLVIETKKDDHPNIFMSE